MARCLRVLLSALWNKHAGATAGCSAGWCLRVLLSKWRALKAGMLVTLRAAGCCLKVLVRLVRALVMPLQGAAAAACDALMMLVGAAVMMGCALWAGMLVRCGVPAEGAA